MRPVLISAVTRTHRHAVLPAIDEATLSAGGWVEGHTLFSNKAITFRLMLPASRLAAFGASLGVIGVTLDEASRETLAAVGQPGDSEVRVILSVTLIHDEPDLAIEVPAVPG